MSEVPAISKSRPRPMPDTYVSAETNMKTGSSAFIVPSASRRSQVGGSFNFRETSQKGGLMGELVRGGAPDNEQDDDKQAHVHLERQPFMFKRGEKELFVNFHPDTVVHPTQVFPVHLTHVFEFEPSKAGGNSIMTMIPSEVVQRAIKDAAKIHIPDTQIPGCLPMQKLVKNGDRVVVHGGSFSMDTNYEGPFGVEWFHAPHYNQKNVGGKNFMHVVGPDAHPFNATSEFDVSKSINSNTFKFLGGLSFDERKRNEFKPDDGEYDSKHGASKFDVRNNDCIFRLGGHLADSTNFMNFYDQRDVAREQVRMTRTFGNETLRNYKENYDCLIPDARLEKGIRLNLQPISAAPSVVVLPKQERTKGSACERDESCASVDAKCQPRWQVRNSAGDPMPDKCFGNVNMTLYVSHLREVPNNSVMSVPVAVK